MARNPPQSRRCAVFPADDALARDLAAAAGRYLIQIRAAWPAADEFRRVGNRASPIRASQPRPDEPGVGESRADQLRRAGDLGSQDFLARALARARPDDAVLSEEA